MIGCLSTQQIEELFDLSGHALARERCRSPDNGVDLALQPSDQVQNRIASFLYIVYDEHSCPPGCPASALHRRFTKAS